MNTLMNEWMNEYLQNDQINEVDDSNDQGHEEEPLGLL